MGIATIVTTALFMQSCAGYVELDLTFFTEMDLGSEVTAEKHDEVYDTGAVAFIHRVDVDLTESNGDLASSVDDVVIQGLAWRVPENTMTADLRDISLLIAPADSESPDTATPIATIDRIPAGAVVETTPIATMTVGEMALEKQMKQMHFAVYIVGYIQVDDPANAPTGTSAIEIDVRGEIHRR